MKKIILKQAFALQNKYLSVIIALLLLFGSAKAQIKEIKIKDTDGIEKWVPYVVGITNVPDVTTKVQRDSMNTSLRNYIAASLTSYQNWTIAQLALKADKGTTGGTGEGQIINWQEQLSYKIFKTPDNGVVYDNGIETSDIDFMGIATHKGRNYPNGILSNAPDHVVQIYGKNSYANGSRKSNKSPSLSIRHEWLYWIDGMGWCQEVHMPEMTMMDGITRRINSYYIPINGAPGLVNMEMGTLNISESAPNLPNAKTFFTLDRGQLKLISTAPGRAAGIILQHNDGTQMLFDFTGGVPQLKMVNPSAFGGGSFTYSYGELYFKTRNGNKVYVNEAAAKVDGFKSGEIYKTRINGIKVLAEIE